jgi:hypothetical protein
MRNFGNVFRVVLGAALLVVSIGAAAAGPEVKRGQLEWQNIAHDDGAVMYDNLCAPRWVRYGSAHRAPAFSCCPAPGLSAGGCSVLCNRFNRHGSPVYTHGHAGTE